MSDGPSDCARLIDIQVDKARNKFKNKITENEAKRTRKILDAPNSGINLFNFEDALTIIFDAAVETGIRPNKLAKIMIRWNKIVRK